MGRAHVQPTATCRLSGCSRNLRPPGQGFLLRNIRLCLMTTELKLWSSEPPGTTMHPEHRHWASTWLGGKRSWWRSLLEGAERGRVTCLVGRLAHTIRPLIRPTIH